MSSILLEETRCEAAVSLEPDTKEADRQLLIDSRRFAVEDRRASWWHLLTTLGILAFFGCATAFAGPVWVRLLASVMTGLTLVRMFILYHDYQHQAIFKDSFWAGAILRAYGVLMLTPPSVWKRSHDHHHKNNSKMFGASIGSFPIMTTSRFANATRLEKLEYRIARCPLVIIFGYAIVFLFGMSIRPLILDPKRHLDAPLSLLMHFGLIVLGVCYLGWLTTFLLMMLPAWVASAAGAYLFYVQHNFPDAEIRSTEDWTYTQAALKSSSFLEMGPVMNWLTGNIGYHHVHHLNAKIPFYRLPEAMSGLVPLQSPKKITLGLDDIAGCLRLKLWDVRKNCFVTFAEAKS